MEGYAKLAHLMSTHHELAIFRRFKALNMQNLLYLQAEITHLEAELLRVAREDVKHGGRQHHAHDWWSLSQGEFEGDGDQWETVLEIRNKLETYSRNLNGLESSSVLTLNADDALLKQAAFIRLDSPTNHDLGLLRSWFERPGMGAFPLLGMDRHAWNKEYEADLVAVRRREYTDSFSEWITDKLIPVFHHAVGSKFKVCLEICPSG
jgi:hypothetical protein